MENNKKVKYTLVIANIALALLIFVAIGFAYKFIFIDKANQKSSTDGTISIDEKKYESITSPQNYGTPISTSSEGFGRSNPFAQF